MDHRSVIGKEYLADLSGAHHRARRWCLDGFASRLAERSERHDSCRRSSAPHPEASAAAGCFTTLRIWCAPGGLPDQQGSHCLGRGRVVRPAYISFGIDHTPSSTRTVAAERHH